MIFFPRALGENIRIDLGNENIRYTAHLFSEIQNKNVFVPNFHSCLILNKKWDNEIDKLDTAIVFLAQVQY